ncbi:MAG: hypothetical protein AABY22_09555 [Nanoarchaeota archaeon]
MSLELNGLQAKDLYPYIGTDLRIEIEDHFWILVGIVDNKVLLRDLNRYEAGHSMYLEEDVFRVKPILYPFTKIWESIDYRSKNIIPADYVGLQDTSIKNSSPWNIMELFDFGDNHTDRINTFDGYSAIIGLCEMHIDVFGLIDEGLAISK